LSNEFARPPDSGDQPVYPPAYKAPAVSDTPSPYSYEFTPRRRFQHRWRTHIILLVLTVGTTLFVGGPWYSMGVLAILGAHEMGHYLACRRYNVDATLPYFIPAPPPVLSGTLGAVIRIKEPFPSRKALFDIGIAGPIAGFVVLVPVLFLGMAWSRVIEVVPTQLVLGRPLLYQFVRWFTFGHTFRRPTSSSCTRSCWPPGSACWPPRSICCRSASSMADTFSTRWYEGSRHRSR
jgi:hypothetical protein